MPAIMATVAVEDFVATMRAEISANSVSKSSIKL